MRGMRRGKFPRTMAAILIIAASSGTAFSDTIILGGEVNISGATLFRDFFSSPASTNDFVDVDADGLAGFDPDTPPFVDQLAPLYGCPDWIGWWLVQYRGVGSVNGLGEFVDFQLLGIIPESVPSEKGYINRIEFASGGQPTGTGCPPCNASNTPYCPSSIDLAVLDVPTGWAVTAGSQTAAAWNRKPTENGYGFNPIVSSTGYVSNLQSLSRGSLSLNTNTANPDENTVYDTAIAWVPIAYIANRGTGIEHLRISELQYLFTTGRLPSGQNLVAVTRSVGSGTRNGIMNTSGIDPSWGRGDNLGDEYADITHSNLGPGHIPTNCEGSSLVEKCVENRRLGVGYAGLAGPSRAAADALAGRYEIIDVMFDDRGGAQYVRPTIDSVLDNCDPSTGYQLGGPETFASRGDPFETNPASPAYMANQAAADYLWNIAASVAAFAGDPPSELNYNMPGELLALTYFLLDGIDCLPDPADPTDFSPNQALNQTLQDFIRANNGLGIGGDTPAYGSVNIANLVPKRNANPDFDPNDPSNPLVYSDGSSNGNYADFSGSFTVQAGWQLNQRNQIAGDFNNDGQRDADDIEDLVAAVTDPRGFVAAEGLQSGDPGQLGSDYVIPEIIGDFNGDGNLDAADVRYFADGLALDPTSGTLDRRQGFIRVDLKWFELTGSDNYFGTQVQNAYTGAPRPYAAGDSRFDVAGNQPTPGAPPLGADGFVNRDDFEYVHANVGDWSDLDQAVFIDLSCDMNGDLLVNTQDLAELAAVIGAALGDLDWSGSVDLGDLSVLLSNYGAPGPHDYAAGDIDGDGDVDLADLATLLANYGFTG